MTITSGWGLKSKSRLGRSLVIDSPTEIVRRALDVGDSYRMLRVVWIDRQQKRMGCEDACGNVTEFPWSPEPQELFQVK